MMATSVPVNAAKDLEQAPKTQITSLFHATFAGGCFWCSEADFQKIKGVNSVISGFSGGSKADPTYKEVASGKTTHVEAIQVEFNPKIVTYIELLEHYFKHIDPTDAKGQFVDRGAQYRPVIFYHSTEQGEQAKQIKHLIENRQHFDEPIQVEITAFSNFFPAEDYHQDYFLKNPIRYKFYRSRSGRDDFIEKHWDNFGGFSAQQSPYRKRSEQDLQETLTPLQYKVTQKDGTEKPFDNAYWDNKEAGIYVDIVSGEPLFSSLDKYQSGTGWPSFTKPLLQDHVVERKDYKLFSVRTEVRSKYGDSHLGHVFDDGPAPTGMRYCINSAALRFIPVSALEESGYSHFLALFEAAPSKDE